MKKIHILYVCLLWCMSICTLNAQITATVKHVGPNNWGSITLQINGGAQPYGFKWYRLANIAGGGTVKVFLSNDQSLKDLEPNTYCVEVEDENCCKVEQCFTVKPCTAELIFREGIDYVVTPATSCNTKDGTIKIINPPTFDGITPALLLLNPPFSGSFLYPLQNSYFPGKYDILSYNNFSCRSDKSIEIKAKTTPEVIADIDYPCSLKDKGSINLSVSVPVYQNANSTYLWSNGATTNALKDVIAGVYCVTITTSFPSLPFGGLPTSCKFEKCYELGKNPLPLSMGSPKTTYSCVTNSGQIEVVAAGGSKPYSYKWSNGATTSLNSNIPSGIYSVTVTDRCGSQVIAKDVVIAIPKPISVSLSIQNPNDCALKTDINLLATALGGIPPLSYRWTVNGKKSFFGGSTHPIIYDGKYCVFVSDASDCNIASACFDTDISRIDTTQIPPCFGMSNGSLTLKIHNPQKKQITLFLAGGVFQTILAPKVDEEVTIAGIHSGATTIVKVVLGAVANGCEREFTVKYIGNSVTKVYTKYDNNVHKCFYDQYCNGAKLPTTFQSDPLVSNLNFDGNVFLKCSNDGFCTNYSIGKNHPISIKVDIKWVRVSNYIFRLKQELTAGRFDPVYIQSLIDNMASRPPCAKVRYCPLTMRNGLSSAFNFNFGFNLSGSGIITTNSNGCLTYKCGGVTYNDCDPPGPFGDPPKNCVLKEFHLIELINWSSKLTASFPNKFPNSSLKAYIDKFKDDPRRYCAKVTFCFEDFSFKSSDIDQVECILLPPSTYTSTQIKTCEPKKLQFSDPLTGDLNDDIYVMCQKKCTELELEKDPDCEYVKGQYFNFDYNDKNPLYRQQGDNITDGVINTVIGLSAKSSRFRNFGELYDEGEITPKGIFENGNELQWQDYFYPMSEYRNVPHIPNLAFWYTDVDKELDISVLREEKDRKYSINVLDTYGQYEFIDVLESNSVLNLTEFKSKNADFVIKGTFKGALTYNNTELETTTNEKLSNFAMVIDKQGKLLSFHSTPQFDEQYETIIFGKEKGTKAAGILLDDGIDVNASSHTTTTKGLEQFGIINLGNKETISRLAFDSGLTVIKTTYDEYNKRILCVVLGSGTMYFDSDEIQIGKSKSSASLLSIDETTGDLVWYRPIAVAETNIDNMQITSSADGCYLGFNYEGGLDIDGKIIENVGSKDIAIVSIDPEGKLNSYKNFGSPDNETIKSLLYTKGVLYFGGDLEGKSVDRNIGKNRFIKVGNNQSDAYISFVTDLDFKSDVPGSKAQSTNVKFGNNIKSQFSVQEITASPIPFKDRISVNVRVAEMQVYDIQILDVLGKSVERLQRTLLKGYNVVDIDNLENLKAGVYIVKVMEASGMFKSIKIVKF